jgi:hypothetical protein
MSHAHFISAHFSAHEGSFVYRFLLHQPQVIVNCARRSGDAKVESGPGQVVYWRPMTEANMQEACRSYLKEYGPGLLAAWQKMLRHVYVLSSGTKNLEV